MTPDPRPADLLIGPPPVPLRVVPPDAAAGLPVLESGNTNPLILGGAGPRSFACGGCGVVLLERVRGDEVPNTRLVCAACGARNEGPTGA